MGQGRYNSVINKEDGEIAALPFYRQKAVKEWELDSEIYSTVTD